VKAALAWTLTVVLVLHVALHVAITVQNAREPGRGLRALAGFLLPPLGFWWALEAGRRRLAFAWLATLAAYAVGVAAA
jgi:hypothetical protein